MCTLYTMRTPKTEKGQNKQKSTAVCRTGISSTKLQLFVLFVITKEWKDVCSLLVLHTCLVLENDVVVSKVAMLPTRL